MQHKFHQGCSVAHSNIKKVFWFMCVVNNPGFAFSCPFTKTTAGAAKAVETKLVVSVGLCYCSNPTSIRCSEQASSACNSCLQHVGCAFCQVNANEHQTVMLGCLTPSGAGTKKTRGNQVSGLDCVCHLALKSLCCKQCWECSEGPPQQQFK